MTVAVSLLAAIGVMTFAVMLNLAPSFARANVKPMIAAFAAVALACQSPNGMPLGT